MRAGAPKRDRRAFFTLNAGRSAIAIHAKPKKMRSMPRKSPIAQSAEAGHSAITSRPSAMVMTPSATCQPQPGSASATATTIWKSPPTRKNAAMNKVITSALCRGFTTINRPTTPNRIAASRCWKNPAQCPTMTACAISMPDAATSSQPKNSIDATVAANERTTAARPKTRHADPEREKPAPVLGEFMRQSESAFECR